LQGCVLFDLANLGFQISVNAVGAMIEETQYFFGLAPDADFDDALFKQWVSISFLDRAPGPASFVSTLFLGPADFGGTTFPGNANFSSAVFAQRAMFASAVFQGKAIFDDATFQDSAEFGDGWREKAAQFKGNASFADAKFLSSVNFNKAHFDSEVSYARATLHDLAIWNFCTFTGKCNFERLTCHGVVSFHESKFLAATNFEYCYFAKRTRFTRVKFPQSAQDGEMSFVNVHFADLADFYRAQFPPHCHQFSGAFVGAQFSGVADFRVDTACWIAALDGAVLERKLLLDPPTEDRANVEFFRKMLPGAKGAGKADVAAAEKEEIKTREAAAKKGESVKPISAKDRRKWAEESLAQRLKELEGGCRVVKLAMGRDRNEALEQRYYRFQLLARRERKDTLPWEKFSSYLYDFASDYGASMVRPVAWLTAFLVLFALAYFGMGVALDRAAPDPVVGASIREDAWSALTFSLNNTLRPLSVLSAENIRREDATWVSAMLYHFGPGYGFGIRLLASFQSLLSVMLAFLFALAVRRRFQIG
jgi:uncharacterized protein YjbI with pentapeptide repeats